jgi:hypothetical protein
MKTRPLLLSFGLLALVALSCSDGKERIYQNSDLDLLAGFTAKEYCSCFFVVGQTQDFCDQFIKQSPPIGTVSIDQKNKKVTSHALFNSRTAHWVSDKFGCILE